MLEDGNVKNNIQLLADIVKEYKDWEAAITEIKNKVEILKSRVEVLQKLHNNLYCKIQNKPLSYINTIGNDILLPLEEKQEDGF